MTQLDEASPRPPAESSLRLRTRSAKATKAVAAALADWLEPGDVVVLSGDLGAGKTTFTQGLASELGVTDPVTSPTFAILQHYDGVKRTRDGERPLVINHLDVYRLGSLEEAEALGLDELLDGDAVTLIEWGEGIEPLLGPSRLAITLQLAPIVAGQEADPDGGDPLDHRLITCELFGADPLRHERLDRVLSSALDSDGVRLEGKRSC